VRLEPIDIPQADTLSTVRTVVEAVVRMAGAPVKAIAGDIGVHERHVRYRLAAARALDLLTDSNEVTKKGTRLLATSPGSDAETKEWRRVITSSRAVQAIDPDLLSRPTVDVKAIADKIVRISGLSRATAERRAVVLRAWHRDLGVNDD